MAKIMYVLPSWKCNFGASWTIFYDIQWEFSIYLIYCQFSMFFNRNFKILSITCQFAMLSNWNFAYTYFFVNFPCYSIGSLHFINSPYNSMSNLGDGTEGRKDILNFCPCVLQDIGPLGPLPKKRMKRLFRNEKMRDNDFSRGCG